MLARGNEMTKVTVTWCQDGADWDWFFAKAVGSVEAAKATAGRVVGGSSQRGYPTRKNTMLDHSDRKHSPSAKPSV